MRSPHLFSSSRGIAAAFMLALSASAWAASSEAPAAAIDGSHCKPGEQEALVAMQIVTKDHRSGFANEYVCGAPGWPSSSYGVRTVIPALVKAMNLSGIVILSIMPLDIQPVPADTGKTPAASAPAKP